MYARASSSSGSISNTRGLLSATHLHWLPSNNPITSTNHFDIFVTPPDSHLNPPPVPNDPANPANEPDLTKLSSEELLAYVKSLHSHSHGLVDMLKAQRIQITLDEMVIGRLQQQINQKEQHAKKQGSLTTMVTIVTEPVFVERVKQIKRAAKAKKAKEATQKASARKKALRELRTVLDNGDKDPEDTPVLPVQAPCACQGVVCRNYCEDSNAEYIP
jgi:hypothetical protein